MHELIKSINGESKENFTSSNTFTQGSIDSNFLGKGRLTRPIKLAIVNNAIVGTIYWGGTKKGSS